MTDVTAETGVLAARLSLDLSSDGVPANPLVVLPLDPWRDAPAAAAHAARLVAGALPVTVGVLAGPATPSLEPLIEAATLTLVAGSGVSGRALVPAEDIPGSPDLDEAVARLRAHFGGR